MTQERINAAMYEAISAYIVAADLGCVWMSGTCDGRRVLVAIYPPRPTNPAWHVSGTWVDSDNAHMLDEMRVVWDETTPMSIANYVDADTYDTNADNLAKIVVAFTNLPQRRSIQWRDICTMSAIVK